MVEGRVFAVLDIDSPQFNRFDEIDQLFLEWFALKLTRCFLA